MEAIKNETRIYFNHLTGLKGLAAFLIMFGHFLGIYKYAGSFFPHIRFLDLIKASPFSFLIDELYWLYLFFVVSGYLVSKSNITNIKDVITKSVSRFFRLAIPIFFSYIIIYTIYISIGFHTSETKYLFECAWFQNFYNSSYSIKDVLLSPINVLLLQKVTLNNPYWVLRTMFFSSLLIYFLKFIYKLLKGEEHKSLSFSILCVIMIMSLFVSTVITASLLGLLISLYENSDIHKQPCFAFWFILLAMSVYCLPSTMKSTFFFGVLLIFIPKLKPLERILSSTPFLYVGKISWGIYSFHWPIICSIGALSLINLSENIGLLNAYLVSFIIVLLSTIILSTCFYYTLERFAGYLTKKLSNLVSLTLNKIIK